MAEELILSCILRGGNRQQIVNRGYQLARRCGYETPAACRIVLGVLAVSGWYVDSNVTPPATLPELKAKVDVFGVPNNTPTNVHGEDT